MEALMGVRADQEFIARWRDEPAPLLPILHAMNDRDGYLSAGSLKEVSRGLRIPLADLYGTLIFYHHFSLEPVGLMAPRVCTGPVCAMKGAEALLAGGVVSRMACGRRPK